MTEKKNSAEERATVRGKDDGQGDSSQRPNMYVPEGFEEKLRHNQQEKGAGNRAVKEARTGQEAPAGQAARKGQNGRKKASPGGEGGDKSGQSQNRGQRGRGRGGQQPKSNSPTGSAPEGGRKPDQSGDGKKARKPAVQAAVGGNSTNGAGKKQQSAPRAGKENNRSQGRQGGGAAQQKQNPASKPEKTPQPTQNTGKKQGDAPRKQPGRRGGEARKTPLKIISLGGLGEIGKNLTVYECENDMLVVDCGLAFPGDDLLGVDLVIPDFTYLEKNKDRLRGIFITHGHEDHIGSLAYLLKKINIPVYGTALTIGLIQGKLKEHGVLGQARLTVVKPGDTVRAGCMAVEYIHVNHSIPDSCALAIHTPTGVVIQTGDFKIDYTPIQGKPIDLVRFGELGSKGVLALLCDSTNAEKPGSTPSERIVGDSFEKLFKDASDKRIIVATFASNIHRIQQIVDTAVKTGRKVAVFGRSMLNVVSVATELGYLTVADGVIIDIDQMKNYTDDQLVVICTGSQGEPMSALTRMSMGEHRKVHLGPNDYIIISATPIPGNEKLVGKVVNDLMKLGADVIYERMYDVHVSGHACQDEIKTILSLTCPKFFMPVHGEYKHLVKCAGIAKAMGIDPKNIIISDIGKVMETDGVEMKFSGIVPSGRVLVDGLGVGDVGNIVLKDRKLLSEEGLIVAVVTIDSASGEILSGPDLVSRGFVYVRESEEMMSGARDVVLRALDKSKLTGYKDWGAIKGKVRDDLTEFMYARTKRRPMILPVIQEV